jgi:hypothetical protein
MRTQFLRHCYRAELRWNASALAFTINTSNCTSYLLIRCSLTGCTVACMHTRIPSLLSVVRQVENQVMTTT